MQGADLKDLILLDSDSTNVCYPKYVTNIRNSAQILDMGTNGSPLISNQASNVPHLGTYWFNPNSITNIISLNEMADCYRATMDTEKERDFKVYLPGSE